MGHEMNFSLFPAHFVDSVRILFDLMDTEHVGYITYKQVAEHLPELPSTQLPPNFLQQLSRYTPPNGRISFQHFFTTVRAAIHEQKTQITDQNGISGEKRRPAPVMGLNQQNRRSAYIPQSSYCYTDSNDNESQQQEPEFVKMREKKTQKSVRSTSSQPLSYRFRPLSTNSVCSIGTIGVNDQRWRNSHLSSSLSSGSLQQTTTQDSTLITRHEALLNEEKEILNRGIDNGNRLVTWYKQRLASVQKRAELLTKGMVAMELAVHEQKLNFLRAHATELNRRIISLMESSDRGFPTHINLQIRTQLPQPSDDRTQQLEKQNKLLYQELMEKDRIIDALKKDNAEVVENYMELKKIRQQRIPETNVRPAAMVRPALHQTIIYKQAPSPIKIHDTLM